MSCNETFTRRHSLKKPNDLAPPQLTGRRIRQNGVWRFSDTEWSRNLLLFDKTEEQEAINHRTKARRQSGDQRRERERKLRKAFVLRNGFVLTYSSGTRYPECASSIHTTISTRPAKCKSADLTLQHAGGQDRFYSEKQADSYLEEE